MNLSHWPPGVPWHLELPQTSLYYNLEVAATRYPARTAIAYYGNTICYSQLKRQVDALAGYLQQQCGVKRGDRVALYLQNSAQFAIAFYAILRADASAVLINTMNLVDEVRDVLGDSGSKVAIFGQELAANILPRLDDQLEHAISACYSEYADAGTDLPLPEVVVAERIAIPRAIEWRHALHHAPIATPMQNGPDDLAAIPYTSGTTGVRKGCMHTHRSVMHTTISSIEFSRVAKDQVVLAALPMFHVTGLQMSLNAAIYAGATIVVMTRWDRRCAAMLIERHRVTNWTATPAMLIDFLAQPGLDRFDLASVSLLSGGGAAMPKAVAEHIRKLWGLTYIEGYGLSETMAPTHTNPRQHPKAQCLGIPMNDTTSIVVDPTTLAPMPVGEVGEILVNGPQVFQGYWGKPDDTAAVFVDVDGMRYFRTGDLGYVDDEGYFFFVDRLKRMINASGYKVWPAEVENILHGHPAVQEACVIACRDPHRGESVKALVVLRKNQSLTGDELIAWSRQHMSAYKAPHVVEFVDALPRGATGKVAWRMLQERELATTKQV
ncbi:long-chain-fatty-acid--CoA ligase [Rudaea sp.]|uniref:long-chain-fatty-acid--CoA ligase n=1 Tax=Rudaea sp. TaxID=2136325 RepID=UPI003782D816